MRALVVEDSPSNLEVVRVILTHLGFEVEHCPSATMALDRCVEGLQPDLILLDVQVPGMDGVEATMRLRSLAATADLPILLVSAWTSVRRDALEAGADEFLPKPFRRIHLIRAVARVLARRGIAPTEAVHPDLRSAWGPVRLVTGHGERNLAGA